MILASSNDDLGGSLSWFLLKLCLKPDFFGIDGDRVTRYILHESLKGIKGATRLILRGLTIFQGKWGS
ncbi:MAG: hypothetical protein D6728_08495 [Cyanobacteria bacterium J055]|nr:MAG: hypothetical protein D6728_08495 [Cyanobacteria bacterium J055]